MLKHSIVNISANLEPHTDTNKGYSMTKFLSEVLSFTFVYAATLSINSNSKIKI